MRISDWSSDVCSSDLTVPLRGGNRVDLVGLTREGIRAALEEAGLDAKAAKLRGKQIWHWIYHRGVTEFDAMTDIAKAMRPWLTERFIVGRPTVQIGRAPSELQSPMRISYAVFCLKK